MNAGTNVNQNYKLGFIFLNPGGEMHFFPSVTVYLHREQRHFTFLHKAQENEGRKPFTAQCMGHKAVLGKSS